MAFDRHRLAARTGRVLRPAAAAIVASSAASAVSLACTRRFTLSQAQFDSITNALAQVDFPGLRPRYEGSEASEAVTDSVTYRGRTVVVDEAALKEGSVPKPLASVLSRLNRLLDSKLATPRNRSP
jgi:hypothetical protein